MAERRRTAGPRSAAARRQGVPRPRAARGRQAPAADARARAARAAVRDLSARGVVAVACCFVDNAGVTRLMSVPLRRFEEAVRHGVGMSSLFSVFLVNDAIVAAPGFEGPSGDFRLVPDPEAAVAVEPMPGWAFAPVDVFDQEGEVFPACPRSFLKRQVEALARRGISVRAAFELEFFLGRRAGLPPGIGEEGDPVPAHLGPGYSPQVLTPHAGFATDLLQALEAQGIGFHKFHPEYSVGQFELSFPARDPVAAADAVVLVRQTIRAAAARHGLDASFAPVVFAGAVGNGCHLHFSLWDRRGRNLFAGGDGPEGMTRTAEAFAAGVLAQLPALVAITCPSVPSYLRLRPHLWSGAHACWGRENREAALRFIAGSVGERAVAANMELKPVDGAGNPYLVLGSVLAAGAEGLARELRLPEPTTEDPAAIPSARARRMGLRRLPGSLAEAVAELERSEVLRGAMGEVLFGAFLATRRGEIEAFAEMDEEAVVRAHRWRY
ncbi:MAG TPA: glutamine synthetase family protein [Actinomycetota bacterium]|nr:glutamine synthetase family protein [Actinomycetota bacterium]